MTTAPPGIDRSPYPFLTRQSTNNPSFGREHGSSTNPFLISASVFCQMTAYWSGGGALLASMHQ